MLYSFPWVTPQRLDFMCRRLGTICPIFIGESLKSRIIHPHGKENARHIRLFEKLQIKTMLAHKIQTLGNQPKDRIQHSEYGESLKSYVFGHQQVHYTTQHDILRMLHLDERSVWIT
jgi:hypothetical protein